MTSLSCVAVYRDRACRGKPKWNLSEISGNAKSIWEPPAVKPRQIGKYFQAALYKNSQKSITTNTLGSNV